MQNQSTNNFTPSKLIKTQPYPLNHHIFIPRGNAHFVSFVFLELEQTDQKELPNPNSVKESNPD